jgi:hypothetical protein
MVENEEQLELLVKLNEKRARSTGRIQKLAEALFREADDLDQTNDQLNRLMAVGLILSPKRCGIQVGGAKEGVQVARDLRVVHCGDGSVEFQFKLDFRIGKVTLRLAPQLGGLLDFLCSGAPANDGLVGWRNSGEVHEYIKGDSQTVNPKHYLNGLIYRLKEALADAGLDRDMIQRNKKKGMRFSAEPVKRGRSEALATSEA